MQLDNLALMLDLFLGRDHLIYVRVREADRIPQVYPWMNVASFLCLYKKLLANHMTKFCDSPRLESRSGKNPGFSRGNLYLYFYTDKSAVN